MAEILTRKLIAVSGNSPQIITETLYALGTVPDKHGHFWPDEIEIITTSFGKQAITRGLLQEGQLDAVCQRLGKPVIAPERIHIRCITGHRKRPVDDARDEADHEAMANFITQQVWQATVDNTTQIHASIAGGRKTMTFYLGYAMSLFGRHIDSMSHVLVSEGYEGRPDFYFPTTESTLLAKRPGEETALDAKDARITLTDIPFIRLRNLLPEKILYERKAGEEIDFRNVVDMINLGDTPEAITLEVDHAALALRIGSRSHAKPLATITFKNPLQWEFYTLLLEDTLYQPEVRKLWVRESKDPTDHKMLGDMLLSRFYERHPAMMDGKGTLDRDALSDEFPTAERTLNSIENGVDGSRFASFCNEIKKLFQQQLPKNLCAHLTPLQMFEPTEGQRHDAVFGDDSKPKKAPTGYGYGIPLRQPTSQVKVFS